MSRLGLALPRCADTWTIRWGHASSRTCSGPVMRDWWRARGGVTRKLRLRSSSGCDRTVEVVRLLRQEESPAAGRGWLLGMNPERDDRAPALVIADEPDLVAAARNFLATG